VGDNVTLGALRQANPSVRQGNVKALASIVFLEDYYQENRRAGTKNRNAREIWLCASFLFLFS
jgi:hypothetical protein